MLAGSAQWRPIYTSARPCARFGASVFVLLRSELSIGYAERRLVPPAWAFATQSCVSSLAAHLSQPVSPQPYLREFGEHLGGGAFARAHRAVHVADPVVGGLGSGPVDAPDGRAQ